MVSKVAYTEETDDMEEAASELMEQFEDFPLMKNSLAIVFTEDCVDYKALYQYLSENWNFPVIGCTAMAMIAGAEGVISGGISVMLMTADDCSFAAGVTEELNQDNYREEIRDCYRRLRDQLGDREKVLLTYGVCVTETNPVSADNLLLATDEACEHSPIIGGLASDNFYFTKMRVFCNDRVLENGQVLALIGGHVEPKYLYVNSIRKFESPITYRITKSKDNVVYELDGKPFIEMMAKSNFETERSDVLREYLQTPFILTIEQPDGGHVEVARNLSYLNHKDGSGIFFGSMPEGSLMEIGIISRDDVKKSLAESMNGLIEYVKTSPCSYQTVICTSCATRFLVLSTIIREESKNWAKVLPEDTGFLGLYSYGEFCPAMDQVSGRDYNCYHNGTYVLLAL